MVDLSKTYESTQVDYQNNYQDDEEEFELASPWKRIGAWLINRLIEVLLMIPAFGAILGMIAAMDSDNPEALAGIGFGGIGIVFVLYMVYLGVQAYFMSRDGQSLGKKLLKIRVVTEDGDVGGFVPVVLMREIVYGIIIGVVSFVIALIFAFALGDAGGIIANVLGYVPTIACLVMLFMENRDRQTLQDMLAKTYVVEAD